MFIDKLSFDIRQIIYSYEHRLVYKECIKEYNEKFMIFWDEGHQYFEGRSKWRTHRMNIKSIRLTYYILLGWRVLGNDDIYCKSTRRNNIIEKAVRDIYKFMTFEGIMHDGISDLPLNY